MEIGADIMLIAMTLAVLVVLAALPAPARAPTLSSRRFRTQLRRRGG